MLARLDRVKPFAVQETMLPAAALSPAAQAGIESYLIGGRRALRRQIRRYITWLHGAGAGVPAAEQQRRFTFLRLRFNQSLSQLDMFSDAITQRSENETGLWLSGLDIAAQDALDLPGGFFRAPPVVCHLHRGLGGAIRRARTRLPGGGENPVSIIRIPRERMIGYLRDRILAGPRDRPPGGRPARPGRVAAARDPAGQPRRGRAGAHRLAPVGTLDLRDRRGPVLDRAGRRVIDDGPDRPGEPAPGVRVPADGRRPAPVRLDPRRTCPAHSAAPCIPIHSGASSQMCGPRSTRSAACRPTGNGSSGRCSPRCRRSSAWSLATGPPCCEAVPSAPCCTVATARQPS